MSISDENSGLEQLSIIYEQLSSEMNTMQTQLARCQSLLERMRKELDKHNASLSTSSSPTRTSLSVSEDEPGSNKWECLSDIESQEAAERFLKELNREVTPKKMFTSTSYDSKCVQQPLQEDVIDFDVVCTGKKKNSSERKDSPPKHICKWPRCRDHQPFYVSSARKMAALSPRSKLLATNRRPKSPKGSLFWSMDMDKITADIKKRNKENPAEKRD